MQKARRHGTKPLRPLVSVWFQGLFHSAVRGSFHLSLTVLVHYRSLKSIQPYQMVLADSHKASPTSRYSGYCYVVFLIRVQDYHLLWYNFPGNSTSKIQSMLQSYNPIIAETTMVWAIPCSLATTQGITELFSLPPGTQMFQFSGLASSYEDNSSSNYQVVPFGNPRVRIFAPNRGLSQLITSFIAFESLGIRHTPLITFLLNN